MTLHGVHARPDSEPPTTVDAHAVTAGPQDVTAGPGDVTAALADAATIGPFFELRPVTEAVGWVPFARLHADPGPLSDRIETVR